MDIVVPQLGESVIEARVARWLKREGEPVATGEPLVELETDKIDLEVNADSAGVLSRIVHKDGDDVKVGEVLGVIEQQAAGSEQPAASSVPPQAAGGMQQAPAGAQQAASVVGPSFPPPLASADRRSLGEGGSSGTAAPSPSPVPPVDIRATATARKVAAEHGVNLASVPGSGDGGRITKEDVQKHVSGTAAVGTPVVGPSFSSGSTAAVGPSFSSGNEKAATPTRQDLRAPQVHTFTPPAPVAPVAPTPPVAHAPGERVEERVRMSKRRATIAKRLVEAQHTAAMLTTFNEVDMAAMQALRARRKEAFQKAHGVSLGLSSFFVKAAVAALRAFPRINAEIQGDEMVLKHYYDIGIAVGASSGLVVPVLRDADRLSFWQIESSIKDFAKRAEEGTLSLEEIKGGTFTITNGGVFGSLLSTPILNPPQVGILGLHKIEERPVAQNGQVVIRPMMYVALSYDHRIVDGLEAVQFLVKVKEFIEDPGHLLVEG
jgi:2-oxoglutarate dehydrogenase E2 component (dihydrolipoamide succinyltransferase)